MLAGELHADLRGFAVFDGVADRLLGDFVELESTIARKFWQGAFAGEDARSIEHLAHVIGEVLEHCAEIFALAVERAETVREIVGVQDHLLDEHLDVPSLLGAIGLAGGQPALESFHHERNAGEALAEVVMQIEADAAAFVLGDFEQLGFETPALFEDSLQLGIGVTQIRRALLDARLEFLAGAAEVLLRAALGVAHFGFAQFAFDGGHQPGEPIFHDVIMRAGAHRGDSGHVFDMA
ncbi:MAG TPA: hypothetical protein VG963_30310, partial [Polyangiaceae bacterium]|nr:hypothetical protein [Polyangiaceae bacterium]